MSRYGISDFKAFSQYYFNCRGKLEYVRFKFSHHLDRRGIEVELDNDENFEFEDALTDIVEWAFKLGVESKGGLISNM
ncbi:MAG: hypothetical protein FWD14_03480 [Treponema sp.]|nr:hypothetical protein [Treponema sp.]